MGHEIVKCKMVSILITAISNSCIHVKRIARYAIKGLWCWGQNRGRESVEEDRLSSEVLLLQVKLHRTKCVKGKRSWESRLSITWWV